MRESALRLDPASGLLVPDWAGMEVAMVMAGTLVIGMVYFMIRRSPRRWWF